MRIASRASLSLAAAAGLVFCTFGASDGYVSFEDDTARTIVFGNRRVYVFTNASAAVTLTAQRNLTLEEFLVVGGGGAGGGTIAGGGGGGGVLYTNKASVVASGTTFGISVGAGGAVNGGQGGHSSLTIGDGGPITAFGGGGGASWEKAAPGYSEKKVGSGGGATSSKSIGSDGVQWNSTQGHAGGKDGTNIGGGGGGAKTAASGKTGGEGRMFALTGAEVVYGSGGGGGTRGSGQVPGEGGTNAGRGGQGGQSEVRAGNGVDGTGGGGGGDGYNPNCGAGRGGCGTVILVFTAGDHTESAFAVLPVSDSIYLGEAVEPAITVTNRSGVVLTRNADYTVSYRDNAAPGTGYAIATGCSGTDYEGFSAFAHFAIHAPAFSDEFVASTDGTLRRIDIGDRRVYVFTNAAAKASLVMKTSMTFEEYLVVGGGGAGGNTIAGGGGGGGVISTNRPVFVTAGTEFGVTVGAGGRNNGSGYYSGYQGGHSILAFLGQSVTAYGGGGGAGFSYGLSAADPTGTIGSGGGSTKGRSAGTFGVHWAQGKSGGVGKDNENAADSSYGGGGGGAGTAGYERTGGEGRVVTITGAQEVYGSGGGGGSRPNTTAGNGGTNAGHGGQALASPAVEEPPGAGVDGFGGGGGGGGYSRSNSPLGGRGGCGTVILSFSEGDHTEAAFAILPIADQVYAGEAVTPSLTVTNRAGVVLTEGEHYTVAYDRNEAGGTGFALATGVEGTPYAGFSTFAFYTIRESRFADDNIRTSDGLVQVIPLGKKFAYVFTNSSVQISMQARRTLTIEEVLVVGGGGAGGNTYGTGGSGGQAVRSTDVTLFPAADILNLHVGAGGGIQLQNRYLAGLSGGSSGLEYGEVKLTAAGGAGGAGLGKNGGDGIGTAHSGKRGGEGLAFAITGEEVVYGSGGGGGADSGQQPGEGGTNGGRGGAYRPYNGTDDDSFRATPGVDGTGSGGGGGSYGKNETHLHPDFDGGVGGCGTVILLVSVGDHVNNRFAIAPIGDQLFHGEALEPKIVVTNAVGMVLLEGTDYTVSYVNNAGVGVAKAIATGVADSDFDGFSAERTFNILPGGYLDENLDTSDPTVRKIPSGGKFVYVFTNAAEAITLTARQNLTLLEYLVVGGGGAGGNSLGGGGGGGGIVHTELSVVIPEGEALAVTVGAGGAPRTASGRYQNGYSGGASSFGFGTTLVTAYGGGGGGGYGHGPEGDANGRIGSGGGATSSAGIGIEGVNWNPDQSGHKGGVVDGDVGGGGGGAGTAASGKAGGEGAVFAITGEDVVYGSGGGGGARPGNSKKTPGTGGTNAGDGGYYFRYDGTDDDTCPAKPGVDGTGSGGGGGGYGTTEAHVQPDFDGGCGGCGTVILVFEPGGEIGQPKVGAIGIDFPDGHTQPLVSATIVGEEDGMTFLAEVVVRARIGDGDWLDTRTFTDVTNGQEVAFLANFAAPPGENVYVEVAVTAPGAQPVLKPAEEVAVGTYPENYGKGGGAGVIHVNPAAMGRNDGSDWFNAYTDFRVAVASLSAEKPELWMAGGETLSTVQPATISPTVEVKLRGGFAGVETNAADRVAGGHSTMDGSNLFDPFVIANDAALTMDGFKVVRAKQSAIKKTKGGDLTVVNCVLDNNGGTTAEASGRAVMVTGTAATTLRLKDLVVTRNFGSGAWHPGLAVCLGTLKEAIIENCLFLTNGIQFSAIRYKESSPGRNDSTKGATLYAKDAPLTVGNCRFSASRGAGVTAAGGIIWIEGNCGASSFRNCVFTGNESVFPIDTYSATYPGRKTGTLVLSATAGTLDVENCTFAWNLAEAGRGATGVEVAGGTANVKNCIFHGGVVGTNNVAGVDIDVMAGGTANVSYCLFDADDGLRLGCETGGTLNPQTQTFQFGDPLLASEIDVMALVQTNRVAKTAQISFKDSTEGAFVTADVHERRHSPAIDTGDRKSPYANEPKPNGRRVNLGAYGNTPEAAKSPDGGVLIVR